MNDPRRIAVVTGSRAEFGLLRPVLLAIAKHPTLDLRVVVAGTHLLSPASTIEEVKREFTIAVAISMQSSSETGRPADAAATGRGILAFAEWLRRDQPDVVLVLGDRIEAFAAAAAASIGGIRVAHMHGGDRAEGIADEALRHAITKLAHIHFPATIESAQRIIAMGEDPRRIHIVGSPAIDSLHEIPPLSDSEFDALGRPRMVILLHPSGGTREEEHSRAASLLRCAQTFGPTLALDPNHDAGREGIMQAIEESGVRREAHLPREKFIGLLRRVGLLVGNSSAGLIEAAALGVRCVNIGSRQAGRERAANVFDVPTWHESAIKSALDAALYHPLPPFAHPFGNGTAGPRAADILAQFDPALHSLVKRNSY